MRLIVLASLLSLQGVQDSAADLISKLSSSDITVREEAASKLKAFGKSALPALEIATKDKDIEVALRAKDLISAIQARAAQEFFEKLSTSLRNAKTIKVKARFVGMTEKYGQEELDGAGALLIRNSNNQASLAMSLGYTPRAGSLLRSTVISLRSDGEYTKLDSPSISREISTRPQLSSDLIDLFMKGGFWLLSTYINSEGSRDPKTDSMAATLSVSDWSFLAHKSGVPSVCYALVVPSRPLEEQRARITATVRLWYDGETMKPMKRRVVFTSESHGLSPIFEEEYSEWELDGEIKDAEFKLKR